MGAHSPSASEPTSTAKLALLELAPDIVMLHDTGGRIVEINARGCLALGYRRDELLAKTVFDLDLEARPGAGVWASLTEGTERTVEGLIQRKDGTTFPVEVHLTAWGVGADKLIAAVAREITERRRTEAERVLTSTVFESTAEGIVVTDARNLIIAVNPAVTRITGYDAGSLIGKTPRVFGSGLHPASFYREMWRSIDETGRWQGEIWNRNKAGRVYPEWLSIATIRDERGVVTRHIGLFRDIADQKRAEEALLQSERRYRDLVETSHDLIWSADPEGRLAFVNRASRLIFGREPQEMLGRPWTDFSAPDRVEEDRQFFEQVRDGARTGHHETVHLRSDGNPIVLSISAIRVSEDGETSGVARDVTMETLAREELRRLNEALQTAYLELERRIAERTQTLQRSQGFSDLLLDSVERWVIVIGREGQVVKANAAARALFGESLVGRRFFEVQEGRDTPLASCPVQRTFATGRPHAVERSLEVRGAIEIVQIETCPMLSAEDRVDTVVQMGRIITPEREHQAQLAHNERMAAIGLLAAGMAHDIGNPLSSIKSQLQMARLSPDVDITRRTLVAIEHDVDRIGRMLRELVDFARRRRDDRTRVSLNRVVADVSGLLSHDPRATGVQIETRLDEHLPPIVAREDELVNVLFNLGVNALDAMHGGGRLTYETLRSGDTVVVRVSDSGDGVPPEIAERIFEPFFTTKGPGKGTGLGLFVSRKLVERLGGNLELAPPSTGGSTFVVTVPTDPTPEA